MKFITIVPFDVWVYLAILLVLFFTFGIPGVAIGAILIMLILALPSW